MSGTLYIVATPIGNLSDMTFRAIETLKSVDIIACEDTRVTGILLAKYDIRQAKLISYFSHNEKMRLPKLMEALKNGKNIAQVSDAGTPGISDPGNRLVMEAVDNDISIVPIPGVSALTTIISVSQIPTRNFYFEGFLPTKKGRKTRLEFLSDLESPVVLYESTHRILKLFDQINEYFGERDVVVGRELTKMYETLFHGSVNEAAEFFSTHSVKGEFTVIISGKK